MGSASKTRVCIKNLPPAASEQDLREFLTGSSSKERIEITDCRVLKNAKGKSRKVAFVGFRHEIQAKFIVDNFHRTFMGMSRLSAEPAMAKKDEEKDAKKAAELAKGTESSKGKPGASQAKLSKSKQEILKLAGSGKQSKFWANDEEVPVMEETTQEDESRTTTPIDKPDKDEESGSDSDSDSDTDSSSSEESDDEEKKPENPKPPSTSVSDLDFLRSKQKTTDDLEEEDNANSGAIKQDKAREEDINTDSEAEDDDDDSSSSSDEDADADRDVEPKTVEAVAIQTTKAVSPETDGTDDMNDEMEDAKKEETSKSRLFVRNLPFETTEEELEEYFSVHGSLVECHIPVDDQKRNKGFAFVQYSSAVDALEARKQLDGVDFQGRLLHILPSRPAPAAAQSGGDEGLTWKKTKEQARKDLDTKSGADGANGWSASFVRGDAVVDNLADRLGLRKADFLGVKDKLSSGDAAVRLALGETQIIEENREYFRQNGVDMEALVSATGNEKTAKRSKTNILVKNLPYDTRLEELTKLFQVRDESVNILLPPSRTIALVEYGHHSDAKKAFRQLAYRRFKHVPIYLEWAPLAAKTEKTKEDADPVTDTETTKGPISQAVEDGEPDVLEGASSTIYVKNLNFGTNEEAVRQVFEKNVGPVRSVRIPQKVAPVRSGEEPQLLSMGYGFVELESESAVRKAIQVLQGKLVEGHAWEVTISSNKNPGQKSKTTPSGKNPTKLIVRNVPFQATRTELLKLFGSFGQLRRVRLPKKFDGSHRGFGFIEFVTSKEAVAAMNALSRTHLYGRHLVLEWATDDDQDVDRLRDKAKRDTEALPQNKKIRFT